MINARLSDYVTIHFRAPNIGQVTAGWHGTLRGYDLTTTDPMRL